MAIATVAGLILGGASKPNIREMTDLDGPQLLSGKSGSGSAPASGRRPAGPAMTARSPTM
uniref:Uncharacterized protein n=1 Tax=Phenylobacterium glaciei TaxID=2803784 RepID=A0A974P1R2_9CAUL|nr:hypothetical protein JKL49_20000 [Phenylobacterium glaciei]